MSGPGSAVKEQVRMAMEWLVFYFLLVVCLSAYFLRLLKRHLATIQGKHGLHSLDTIMANNLIKIPHSGDHLISNFFIYGAIPF